MSNVSNVSNMSNLEETVVDFNTLPLSSVMNVKFKIYSYITPDHEPGALIVHPDLVHPFDTQKLFEMDEVVVKEISLFDILKKGFIKIGSTDTMDKMDIEYPLISNEIYKNNKIVGKHWSHTPKEVADMIGKEFEIESNSTNLNIPDNFDSFDLTDSDESSDSNESQDLEISEIKTHNQIISVLDDGKMDEIFEKINECENTSIRDVDRLLSELEF